MQATFLKYWFFIASVVSVFGCTNEQVLPPQNGNPLLPGYFADPTIKKFGDTWYIYATTDGVKLASGEPTVWLSKDFVNWYIYEMEMDLPEGLTNCWAPDVVEGSDGRYYYFMGNCQFGCNIYGYVSDSPMGPWTPINEGKAVIPVGTSKEHLPALDAQFFEDDNGDLYSYFGTWCTSFGGMGWARFNPAGFSLEETSFIPIKQIPKAFEAAYMLKHDSIYYLMYSAGDCKIHTYEVHYAWAESPTGPFHYGTNNPILASNDERTVDGPGHHSVLKEGDDYYMIYHRHDNPHSSGGMFRQVCADKMMFGENNTIEKIMPTENGIGFLGKNTIPVKDLAEGTAVSASSFYHLKAIPNRYNTEGVDYKYVPENAVDNNNGTLWKAADATFPQTITIDFGEVQKIRRIATQFEYATYFYQYKLEVSEDNTNWQLFADRSENKRNGSPMIDDNNLKGRYVRLTISGVEKTGMFAGVWNIRVYNKTFEVPSFSNPDVNGNGGVRSTNSNLVDLDVSKLSTTDNIENQGSLGGKFMAVGKPSIKKYKNVPALYFDGKSWLELAKKAPESLNWNAPFTVSAWVCNPEIAHGECIIGWNSRRDMLQGSYAAMYYGSGNYGAMAHGDYALDLPFKNLPPAGEWQHILVTFDGMLESVYVNGVPDNQQPLNLFVNTGKIRIGASGEPSENLTGYIARVQLFDKVMTPSEIIANMNETKPFE